VSSGPYRPFRTDNVDLNNVQAAVRDFADQLEDPRRGVIAYPSATVSDNSSSLREEAIVRYVGTGGSLMLPPAQQRGRGRGQVIAVINEGKGSLTLKAGGGVVGALKPDTLSIPVSIAIGGLALLVSDGFSQWAPVMSLASGSLPYVFDVSESIASAAAATWDGLQVTGTATLTGTTSPVAPATGFDATRFKAPAVTAASPITVPVAATVKVDGPPVAGGSAALTVAYAIWAVGSSLFDRVLAGASTAAAPAISFAAALASGIFNPAGTTAVAIATDGVEALRVSPTNQNLLVGTTTDSAASKIKAVLSKTVASATSAVWDGLSVAASTLTLTLANNVTTATGVNAVSIAAPTISAGSALAVSQAATFAVLGAPAGGGAGPATVTKAYGIWGQAANNRFFELECDLNSRVASNFTTTSGSLVDITGLFATVTAGASYAFEAVLFCLLDTSGGGAWSMSGTCTATTIVYDIQVVNTNSIGAWLVASHQTALNGSASTGGAGVTEVQAVIRGLITVNAAGTLRPRFAQAVGGNPASTVRVTSHFKVQRIA
jgi:hypothetical protein